MSDSRFADLDRTADAAVLIAVTERPDPTVLLTQRPRTMRDHPGQVAFPGGKLDEGENAVEAALREAWEELAIAPEQVRLIGTTDRYQTGTGFDITRCSPPFRMTCPSAPTCARRVPAQCPLDKLMMPQAGSAIRCSGKAPNANIWNWITVATASGASPPQSAGTCRDGSPGSTERACRVLRLRPTGEEDPGGALPQSKRSRTMTTTPQPTGQPVTTSPGWSMPVPTTSAGWAAACATRCSGSRRTISMRDRHLPATVIDRCKAAGIRTIPTGSTWHGYSHIDDGNVEITRCGAMSRPTGATPRSPSARNARRCGAAGFHHQRALCASARWRWTIISAASTISPHAACASSAMRRPASVKTICGFYGISASPRGSATNGMPKRVQPAGAGPDAEGAEPRTRRREPYLLALPDPAPTVHRMRELGVLQEILPESGAREVDQLARLVAAERDAALGPDAMRRMAALLPPIVPAWSAVVAGCAVARAARSADLRRTPRYRRRRTSSRTSPIASGSNARSPLAPGRGRYVALEGLEARSFRSRAAKSSRAGLPGVPKWRVCYRPSSVAGSTNTFLPAHALWKCRLRPARG